MAKTISPLSKKRILVVDDEQDNLDVMAGVFKLVGAVTTLSKSGKEALEMLESPDATGPFDLIILDIQMPMTGWEVIARIRANPRIAHLPVIAFTALPPDQKQKLTDAGFNDYYPKPITSIPGFFQICIDQMAGSPQS